MIIITFKSKIENGFIHIRKSIRRTDIVCGVINNPYSNSDLFPGMLNAAYLKAIGGTTLLDVADLPPEVSVDDSEFLAQVTVSLPDDLYR